MITADGQRRTDRKLLLDAVVHLYTLYHGYDRFAREHLGVDIDTWLAFHPESGTVLAGVRELLDRDILVEVAADRHEDVGLDELAELYHEAMAEQWAEIVDEIPD